MQHCQTPSPDEPKGTFANPSESVQPASTPRHDSATSPREFARLAALPLEELAKQCRVESFHATGPGGQCVNTADSAVRTVHVPTGIAVVSRESRSQFRNRQLCLQKLREEFARRAFVPKTRHATKATRGSKERRLQGKRVRSQVKASRSRPSLEE